MRGYLVDTNVFMHVINNCVCETAQLCVEKDKKIKITETIIKELTPGYYHLEENENAGAILNNVQGLMNPPFKLIDKIDFSSNEEAQKIFDGIRNRYYGWMKRPDYLRKLVSEGKLDRTEIKNLKKKDVGECELLALAKVSKGYLEVVTKDKGRVYLHPNINIYEMFENDEDVTIHDGNEWLRSIQYNEGEKEVATE